MKPLTLAIIDFFFLIMWQICLLFVMHMLYYLLSLVISRSSDQEPYVPLKKKQIYSLCRQLYFLYSACQTRKNLRILRILHISIQSGWVSLCVTGATHLINIYWIFFRLKLAQNEIISMETALRKNQGNIEAINGCTMYFCISSETVLTHVMFFCVPKVT